MQLYYTNSQKPNGEQTKPSLSLGGYISGSTIPNDLLNNIITDISRLAIDNNGKETIIIALTNTLSNDVENVKIWFEYPTDEEDNNASHVKLELAIVDPTVDDCGDYVFERLNSFSVSPLYATFSEPNSNANAINVGTIEAGKSVGIWIRKTINKTNASPLSCDQLYENFKNNVTLDNQQTIDFFIHYNEENSVSISLSGI